MANLRDRHDIISRQHQIEVNVKHNSVESRDNLKKLYNSVKSAEERDIGAGQDENTNMFLQLRGDMRALAVYFRENILGDTKHDNQKLDRFIIDMEKKFALREGNDPEEQILSGLCLELAKGKDKFVHKIMAQLLDETSFERTEVERNPPGQMGMCSREISTYFNFFKTFRGLLKATKSVELSRAEIDAVDQLADKDAQLETLQEELLKKGSIIMDLKQQIHALSNDVTRAHMITRQQDHIVSLEKRCAALERDTQQAIESQRRSEQQAAQAEDMTAHVQKQLSNVRAAYDRDISKLRPLLEDQVVKSQRDMTDIKSLKTESSLHAVRIKDLEAKWESAQKTAVIAQGGEKRAKKDLVVLQENVLKLEQEISRQQRSKLVVIAAKLHFQQLAKGLEEQVTVLEDEVEAATAQSDEHQFAVGSLRNTVEALEKRLRGAEEAEASLRDTIKRLRAEHATFQLQNKNMKKTIESSAGGSGVEQERVDDMAEDLRLSRDKCARVEKQLKAALQRVYELQGQIMDRDEAEREAARKKKRDQAAAAGKAPAEED